MVLFHFRQCLFVLESLLLLHICCTTGVIAYGTNSHSVSAEASKEYLQACTFHQPSVPWDINWDGREPKSLVKGAVNMNNAGSGDYAKIQDSEENENVMNEEMLNVAKCKVTRNLFLIRHGQYRMDGQGDEEKGLSALGIEQARLTALRLADLSFPYTILIQSSMTRAMETAEIISQCLNNVPSVTCEMIREGAPIPPEPPVSHWRPEAQKFSDDGDRIEAAFRKYFYRADPCQEQDSYEIIVCHANVIRYFVCRAMQFPPEAWLRFSLHNGSITWLVIHPNGHIELKGLGDSGHIPPDKLTTS